MIFGKIGADIKTKKHDRQLGVGNVMVSIIFCLYMVFKPIFKLHHVNIKHENILSQKFKTPSILCLIFRKGLSHKREQRSITLQKRHSK